MPRMIRGTRSKRRNKSEVSLARCRAEIEDRTNRGSLSGHESGQATDHGRGPLEVLARRQSRAGSGRLVGRGAGHDVRHGAKPWTLPALAGSGRAQGRRAATHHDGGIFLGRSRLLARRQADRVRAGAGRGKAAALCPPARGRGGGAPHGHAAGGLRPEVAPRREEDRLRDVSLHRGPDARGNEGPGRAAREGAGWFDFMEPAGQYDVAPDGSEIAYVANSSKAPHHLLRWALFTVPTSGKGPIRCLTPEGTPKNSSDAHSPRYAPDGRSIVYGLQRDPYFYADKVRLVRYDRAAGTHTVLTEAWDRSPAAWEFLADGTLMIEAEDRGRLNLFAMKPGAATPQMAREGGASAGLAPGKDGRIYFTHQTLSVPAEVVSSRPDGSDFKAHTRFNESILSELSLGEVREMIFEGADGDPVQMFVVLPPGFDASKKWPLIHVIHGGPHAIAGDNFHFRWNPQLFAAPGYVVATVNFHGSTSWGQEYAAVIQGGHGDKPFTDIMRATDALLETGFIDERRMAATGGSYGGYLVCWIAGNTDRFRCLVNHAGVFDLLAEYGSDVTQGRHQAYGGEPWDRLEAIDRWSPARFARGFTTPMLVIHGERDYRVPHTQALAVYNIYKAKRVDARLVFFPDENHLILKPRNSIV